MQSFGVFPRLVQMREIEQDPLNALLQVGEFGPGIGGKGVGGVPALVAQKEAAA